MCIVHATSLLDAAWGQLNWWSGDISRVFLQGSKFTTVCAYRWACCTGVCSFSAQRTNRWYFQILSIKKGTFNPFKYFQWALALISTIPGFDLILPDAKLTQVMFSPISKVKYIISYFVRWTMLSDGPWCPQKSQKISVSVIRRP